MRILIIYKRMRVFAKTVIKLSPTQFDGTKIINHSQKVKLNAILRKQITEIENRLLDNIREGDVTKEKLSTLVKDKKIAYNKTTIVEFIRTLQISLKGKLSNGRLKHYEVIANKLEDNFPNLKFKDISISWLNKFEELLRNKKFDVNTLNSNIAILKAILNRAAEIDLIDLKQFSKYKPPKYEQKLIEYLTEEEIASVAKIVDSINKESYKLAGNYFLLSCYTGYRISDAKRFDYSQMVQNDMVVLQAKKNKSIVSIPIHSRLRNKLFGHAPGKHPRHRTSQQMYANGSHCLQPKEATKIYHNKSANQGTSNAGKSADFIFK